MHETSLQNINTIIEILEEKENLVLKAIKGKEIEWYPLFFNTASEL